MSESSIKKIYTAMLESGELLEMFPDLKGDWKNDKVRFSSMYNTNEDTLNDTNFYSAEDLYEEEEY